MALPAAESTQPAVLATATASAPANTETPPKTAPLSVTLACAQSLTRSKTHTVPAERSTTGAATETAIGRTDKALSSETALSRWAWAEVAPGGKMGFRSLLSPFRPISRTAGG